MGNTTFTREVTKQETFTIADVYGQEWYSKHKEELDIAWEWEFRMPKDGDITACLNETRNGTIAESIPIHASMNWFCGRPAIILKARKKKPPTIKDIYGSDDPEIPAGWVSTGEFGCAFKAGEHWLSESKTGPWKAIKCDYGCKADDGFPRLKIRRITLMDVYGTDTITIDPEYEWTKEFRGLDWGDSWIGQDGLNVCDKAYGDPSMIRLIVCKKQPKRVIIAELQKRPYKSGDFVWNPSGFWWEVASDSSFGEYLCGKMEERIDTTPQVVTQADIDALYQEE